MTRTLFCLFLLLTIVGVGSAQSVPLRFEHLTINDGLPENSVRSILQDRHGFLWFGTQNGVARFDGLEMKIHLPDPDKPASIDIRFVLAMAEDSTGAIWMGSYDSGLSVYDPVTEVFTNYSTETDSLPGPGIASIKAAEDGVWITTGQGRLHRTTESGFALIDVPVAPGELVGGLTGLDVTARELWVGTNQSGVAMKDRTNGSWRHLRHDQDDLESLPSDFITFIERDQQGRVWIGTRAGLALHRADGNFKVFKPAPYQGESEANYLVCFTEDPDGNFWIGSATGLYFFDPEQETFTLHPHDPDRPDSPDVGPVLSVLADRSGIIWAGSWHTGLNKYDPGSAKFDVFLNIPGDPGSLDDDSIGAIFEDSQGTLWVGTGSRSTGGTKGGLNFRLPGQSSFSHLSLPMAEDGEQVRTVHTIQEDALGVLWLGTDKGLWHLGSDRENIYRPPSLSKAARSLSSGMINDMTLDRAGRVWVVNWMGGLHRFDPLSDTWVTFAADPDRSGTFESNDLTAIAMDDRGRIWVGTDSGGLYLFRPEEDSFRKLGHLDGNLVAVLHIASAKNGQVLLSTGSGIHLCDSEKVLKSFTTRDGLASDFIGLLVQDDSDNIWASTGLGLVRIDAGSGDIKIYDERDGLPRSELYFSVCKTQRNLIFFGGLHGLISFHPDQMKNSTFSPPVHITEMLVQDQPLVVSSESPLHRALTEAKEIHLGPRQNDISLTFAALDFAHPERNKYRFQLAPHDADWRLATADNRAYYTNLDPGTYNFSVMGTNSDGVWNENPTQLKIIIAPPWYQSSWALAIYAFLFIALVIGVYRHLINRERVRLALEMERAEATHLQKLDHLKSHFFTNISHEFRTPLTLLMSPLQRLQEDPASGSPELFDTMARNARRLGRLIDQLLDLSRLEAERMPAHWRNGDWCQYLKALASSFATLAEQRKIVFTSNWPENYSHAWYDPDILDKVLVNLLSNALKFTPLGGEVTLSVGVTGESRNHPWPGAGDENNSAGSAYILTLTVRNTGTHIPPRELELVFDRFHQISDNSDFADLGSGIGLALVKELTDWCHGRAEVFSEPESGTVFTIALPLFAEAPPGSQPIPEESESDHREVIDEDFEDPALEEDLEETQESHLPQVLLVEDSADLRTYVRNELKDEFQVILAANGQSGLETARSEIPDLILSDVMMPEMDGYELCTLLKADDLTNHIPVVLLTARADHESRKEGLKAGADDYVAKPFDVEELRIRIRNLIEQRRLLAQRYAQLRVARPGRMANPVPSADDRFLTKTRELIIANLEDPDFRVESLCKEVGMSRTQLHRKLKAVAGRSAGEFIRIERLNRAAEMLGSGEGNVTEVAYSVGYRSLSQFAKAFREHFGMVPSDFEA